MCKIDIISGFLGAGKTTLIRKLIKEALNGEKIVLIENEFGEIGVDGDFLADAGIEIKEMNSGCICCSLVGDFEKSLKKVVEEFQPERVIIEPSGVGKLSDVIQAVESVKEHIDITLNSFSTVVDAKKCKMYMKNFGEFFNNQIESATTIILSRSQFLDENKIETVTDMLREHNEHVHIVTTPWDKIDGKEILAVMENSNDLAKELFAESEVCEVCGHHHDHDHHHEHEHHHHDHDHEHEHGECCCHDHDHHHHHHHADEVFTSFGIETSKKYDKATIENILKALSSDEYGNILRAKGMLEDSDGCWHYFDFVPNEYEIRVGKPCYSGRFCVIGSQMKEDAIKALFQVK